MNFRIRLLGLVFCFFLRTDSHGAHGQQNGVKWCLFLLVLSSLRWRTAIIPGITFFPDLYPAGVMM